MKILGYQNSSTYANPRTTKSEDIKFFRYQHSRISKSKIMRILRYENTSLQTKTYPQEDDNDEDNDHNDC